MTDETQTTTSDEGAAPAAPSAEPRSDGRGSDFGAPGSSPGVNPLACGRASRDMRSPMTRLRGRPPHHGTVIVTFGNPSAMSFYHVAWPLASHPWSLPDLES